MGEAVKVFNIHTSQFEAPKANDPGAQFAVSMHEAIRDEKPLPSDRSAQELRNLEPGRGDLAAVTNEAETATGSNAPVTTDMEIKDKKDK